MVDMVDVFLVLFHVDCFVSSEASVNLLFVVYCIDLTIVELHSGIRAFGFGLLCKGCYQVSTWFKSVTSKVLYSARWS